MRRLISCWRFTPSPLCSFRKASKCTDTVETDYKCFMLGMATTAAAATMTITATITVTTLVIKIELLLPLLLLLLDEEEKMRKRKSLFFLFCSFWTYITGMSRLKKRQHRLRKYNPHSHPLIHFPDFSIRIVFTETSNRGQPLAEEKAMV